jgi:hypothetical protein
LHADAHADIRQRESAVSRRLSVKAALAQGIDVSNNSDDAA